MVCQTWIPGHTPEPVRITLTCENAVAAAMAVIGPDPSVVKIEFHFGSWCPPGYACVLIGFLNRGYVTFYRTGGRDLVVIVDADQAGKVTASKPVPVPAGPIPS